MARVIASPAARAASAKRRLRQPRHRAGVIRQKVCMIDMDLGLKNLDVMMGLENRVFYDLKDAVEGSLSSEPGDDPG
ncbi:MAG: hypothetical protein ACLSA6_06360 [Holdemania massiliensis]